MTQSKLPQERDVKQWVSIVVSLAVLAAGVARAGDSFERKAGLWRITLQGPNKSMNHTMDLCLAADTDALIAQRELPMMRAMCSKLENHRDGNTFVTDSVCRIGQHASSTHTVTTPQGDDAYRSVITLQDGKVMTQEGHRAGACPAGMQPGDQVLHVGAQKAEGMKTNLLQSPPAH
jgi:hypothetical protein